MLPEKIGLADKHCKDYCGSDHCDYTWLDCGKFTQGTGFTPEMAKAIVHRYNCYGDLLATLKETAEELRAADLITHHGSTDSGGRTGQGCRSTSAIVADIDAAIAEAEAVPA